MLKFHRFRNDPTIKAYFTVISLICGIRLSKKYYILTLELHPQLKANITSRLTVNNLLSAEVLFTLIDTIDTCTSSLYTAWARATPIGFVASECQIIRDR